MNLIKVGGNILENKGDLGICLKGLQQGKILEGISKYLLGDETVSMSVITKDLRGLGIRKIYRSIGKIFIEKDLTFDRGYYYNKV